MAAEVAVAKVVAKAAVKAVAVAAVVAVAMNRMKKQA